MDIPSKRMLILFISFWALSIFFALIQINGLNKIDSTTLYLVYASLVAFYLGFNIYIIPITKAKNITEEKINTQIEYFTNNIVFKAILITLVLYCCYLFSIYYQQVMFYESLATLRAEYYEYDSLYGPLFRTLNLWVLSPFSLIAIPIFAYKCFYKIDWICFLLGIYLLTYSSLSGGRFGYMRIIVGFIFIIFCLLSKHKNKTKKVFQKTKLIITSITICIVLISVLIFVSAGRDGEINSNTSTIVSTGTEQLSNTIGTYMGGSIVAFDYCLNNNYLERIGGYQYGKLTFSAPIKLISPILNLMGFGYIDIADISFKQTEYINIGPGYFNALYTSLFWFYLDLGIIGVVIFPFILGLLFRWSIKLMYEKNTLPIIIFVFIFFQKALHSVFDYTFVSYEELLFVIILLYFGLKKQKYHVIHPS